MMISRRATSRATASLVGMLLLSTVTAWTDHISQFSSYKHALWSKSAVLFDQRQRQRAQSATTTSTHSSSSSSSITTPLRQQSQSQPQRNGRISSNPYDSWQMVKDHTQKTQKNVGGRSLSTLAAARDDHNNNRNNRINHKRSHHDSPPPLRSSIFAPDDPLENDHDDVTNDNAPLDDTLDPNPRQRRSLRLGKGKEAAILSRTVAVDRTWNLTVWEWEKPAAVIETYWQVQQQGLAFQSTGSSSSGNNNNLLDPFGLVSWPGSVVVAQELKEYQHLIQGQEVLVLGAGVGLEAQAAAQLGAAHVTATDVHPTTLKLLQYGAEEAGLADKMDFQVLDIVDPTHAGPGRTPEQFTPPQNPLPRCNVLIVADVLYNDDLAWHVLQRIVEARHCYQAKVLVSDSQRFVRAFDACLTKQLNTCTQSTTPTRVQWQSRWLPQFTGSGVLLDEDQTYEVKARVLWVGRDD